MSEILYTLLLKETRNASSASAVITVQRGLLHTHPALTADVMSCSRKMARLNEMGRKAVLDNILEIPG